MSTPLPPFGVRGLCSPDKPFSVLQVSPSQYDKSIEFYPDAALTWLDDDDGETITVGSGLELQDRLDDSVSESAPRVTFYNASTSKTEDRYIHIFDVSKSRESLKVWKDHEASWRKIQDTYLRPADQDIFDVPKRTTADMATAKSTDVTAYNDTKDKVKVLTQPLSLSDALPELLGGLVTILQGTADILQLAATKSREANTTPIEDILSGMTTILGEAGACGIDLLKKLDQPVHNDLEQAIPVSPTSPVKSETHDPKRSLSVAEDLQRLSFTDKGDVDMATCISGTTLVRDNAFAAASQASHPESMADVTPIRQAHTLPFVSPSSFLKPAALCNVPLQNSLLDQDAEDADFTARYPPLTTLRRAKTIGGIYTADKDDSMPFDRKSTTASTRPSPQVFDAETQRRKDYARACFPAQEYTPGPGAVSVEVGSRITPCLSRTFNTIDTDLKQDRGPQTDTSRSEDNEATSEPHKDKLSSNQPPLYQANIQERGHQDNGRTGIRALNSLPGQRSGKSLPGAWPVPSTESLSESSGAFFHRMVNEFGVRSNTQDKPSGDPVVPVSRHRSLVERATRPEPANNLTRSQTVNAINPAARLNKPFDATYPMLPGHDVQHQETQAQAKHSPPGPVRGLHRSSSDRRPRTLYEPYRSYSAHRSFSPVWEDHLRPSDLGAPGVRKETACPPLGPVVVFASGFAQGVTEQDISNLIGEHCRDKWGRNCLQECSVLPAGSLVTAKLLIKDSSVVQQLISIFDNLIVGGRLLRFGRSRFGTEAAIQHHLNRKRRHEAPQVVHRMRSMPSFATSARPRPAQLKTPSLSHEIPVDFAAPSVWTSTGYEPVTSVQPRQIDMIQDCEKQLKDMGYGFNDPALLDRLTMYAAAANGSVEEAIELIEDDKKAHKDAAYLKEREEHVQYLEQPFIQYMG